MCIVFAHCRPIATIDHLLIDNVSSFIIVFINELRAFALYSFFIASGFLLQGYIDSRSISKIVKGRFDKIVAPFLIVVFLHVIVYFGLKYYYLSIGYSNITDIPFEFNNIFEFVLKAYVFSIFNFHFWFVAAYILSFMLLLFIHKNLPKYGFYLILIIFSVPYIFDTNFYWDRILLAPMIIYLGMYIRTNYERIIAINKKNIILLMIPTVLILILSSYYYNNSIYNSILRIVYAFCFVVLMLQYKRKIYPDFLVPEKETYGIYLMHLFVIIAINTGSRVFLTSSHWLYGYFDNFDLIRDFSIAIYVTIWTLKFIVAYFLTTLLVKILNTTRLKFIIGN